MLIIFRTFGFANSTSYQPLPLSETMVASPKPIPENAIDLYLLPTETKLRPDEPPCPQPTEATRTIANTTARTEQRGTGKPVAHNAATPAGSYLCDPAGVAPCHGRSAPGVSLRSTARLIAGNPPGSILVNVSGSAVGGTRPKLYGWRPVGPFGMRFRFRCRGAARGLSGERPSAETLRTRVETASRRRRRVTPKCVRRPASTAKRIQNDARDLPRGGQHGGAFCESR